MANVKTAISLQESLFEQAEALADELNISRSRLFSLALEDFIRRSHNRQLLEKLNTAYEDVAEDGEQSLRRCMRRQHRRAVEGEW
jgi:metal-responsive CopG/Arc/MetJ family transcriptional regulator